MTEDRFKDLEVRLRKVEDFILGQLNMLLELSQSIKGRVEVLEDHDIEFMAMVHNSCTLKDKEIVKAKEEAIEISVEHADSNHKQTWGVIAFLLTTIIGITVYFNAQNTQRALDIQKNDTQIEGIKSTLDRIDSKLDKLSDHIGTGK